jgi:hypothetical protein
VAGRVRMIGAERADRKTERQAPQPKASIPIRKYARVTGWLVHVFLPSNDRHYLPGLAGRASPRARPATSRVWYNHHSPLSTVKLSQSCIAASQTLPKHFSPC